MALDPLTAFSLAGTICQFVDFSCKVLSTTRHVYNSYDGDLTVNTELGLVASEIQNLTTKLTRPLHSNGHLSPDEQALKDLCQACNKVAAELIGKLNGLKTRGQHHLWQSFRVAIQSAWSRDDLKDLMARLTMFKDAVESRIVLGLRDQISHLSLQSSDRFDHLDRQTQDIIVALLDSQHALSIDLRQQTMALSQMLNRTEIVIANHNDRTRALIIDAIQAAAVPSIPPDHYHPDIRRSIASIKQRERKLKEDIELKILQSLSFPSMNDRYDEVVEAYRTTFDWIFQDAKAYQRPWDNFVTWLRSGAGVYWINGKVGSGKSTLMRYICNHPATKRELSVWAGVSGLPLSTGSFFFWNSGTKLQRSQVGLLRSLLFTALTERPELIPTVFPWLWAELYMQATERSNDMEDHQYEDQDGTKTKRQHWSSKSLTLEKLMQAFEILLKHPSKPMKLCLFIDGLDEYDGDNGNEGNYEVIAGLFTRISSSANVKVCISSRPLVVLQNAFRGLPGLKLQDLTYYDIEYYTRDNLHRHQRFKQLGVEDPQRTTTLIEEIVIAAEGVFLWVKLVVRSLLSGLSNEDSISTLRRRLNALPKDLYDLYKHMLYNRIDGFYLVKLSEIFQMLRASREQSDITGRIEEEPEPLTALTLSLADDEDLDLAITAKIEPLSATEVMSRCKSMEMQLLNWSAGLLEIQGTSIDDFGVSRATIAKVKGKVQYMHRTVRDFLEQPENWQEIINRTARTGFSPNQSLLRSCVLQLKIISPKHLTKNIWRTAAAAMAYAHKSDAETGNSNTALLNQLDQTMTYHAADRVDMNFHRHWASFPGTFWAKPSEWQDNFLSLTVQYGLCAYVTEALGHGDKVLKSKKGRPLLDYAVNPVPNSQRYPLTPQMVRILLSHGGKPNMEFIAATAWENALAFVLQNVTKIHGNKGRERDILKWLEICEILVEAGANVNAICTGGQLPALSVVDTVFMEYVPEQAAALKQALKTKGASNRISILGKLSTWRKEKRRNKEER